MKQTETLAQSSDLSLNSSRKGAKFPATYWMLIANLFGDGVTATVIPQAGTLWVFYEPGSAPAKMIEVRHQGGNRTPIHEGENRIAVGSQDRLVYELYQPTKDTIKVGFQLE
jgi:hypothetical protein